MKKIGIELGASVTRVFIPGFDDIIILPSAIAVGEADGKPLAAGYEAEALCDRIPGAASLIYPFRTGREPEREFARFFFRGLMKSLRKLARRAPSHPAVLLCLPWKASEDCIDALFDTLCKCGARELDVVDKVSAAALGVDPFGAGAYERAVLVISDEGSEIAVLSGEDVLYSDRTEIGSAAFDAAVAGYLAAHYGIRVNYSEAQRVRSEIGGVWSRGKVICTDAAGVGIVGGNPSEVRVSSKEIFSALREPVGKLVLWVREFIASLPEDAASAVKVSGMQLAGDGAGLFGLSELLGGATGVKPSVAQTCELAVIRGLGVMAER